MKFPCKKIHLSKLLISREGEVEPLCNHCSNFECSNPIENKSVSILGNNKTYRLFNQGGTYMLVIECEGFMLKTI